MGLYSTRIYNAVAYNGVIYYIDPMEALTDIQQAVYDYTRKALQQGQPFPSLREIAQHFGSCLQVACGIHGAGWIRR